MVRLLRLFLYLAKPKATDAILQRVKMHKISHILSDVSWPI